ncbi:unnamed protein product [Brassica rapa]|uniref:NYN domain-containing protein n=2 Tax=Brassica TaxID=3705 RepID=A0A3P5YWJ3_BRACM|nr:unnamed protein product [Brassica napus]CAG7867345.1 unnamed protein product [Brassica rapa]VDC64278.1 unnamed protein product [Brassica rapa]
MMMNSKVPTDAQAKAPTWVFWDINRCPVPAGVDVRFIGPCIKSVVNNLGYMGPLTIIAVGILTDVPLDVLRAIYFSGIALHQVSTVTEHPKLASFSQPMKFHAWINISTFCMQLSVVTLA